MKIAIIGAMEKEVNEYRRIYGMEKLDDNKKLFIGNYCNHQIYLIESGIGKVNAASTTQYMIDKYNVDVVISSGCAGSLVKSVKVLDTVVSEMVTYHDFFPKRIMNIATESDGNILASKFLIEKAKIILKKQSMSYHIGTIASGDHFVTSASERDRIYNETKALAVDMESASIGHVCWKNAIPFISIRVISDFSDGIEDEEEKASRLASVLISEMIKII